jgi:cyclopropane-fatty-acyl-phospholipid synthase
MDMRNLTNQRAGAEGTAAVITAAPTARAHEKSGHRASSSRQHRLIHRHAVLRLLADHMREGSIRFVIGADTLLLGPGGAGERSVTVRVHRERLFQRIAAAGNLGLGEAYMDGDFEMEAGTLEDFIAILLRNRLDESIRTDPGVLLRVLWQRGLAVLRGKRDNIHRHYDLGNDLFASFLDSSLTYSCGYARTVDDDVEQLQRQKLDRICQKLRLRAGESVVDIGCGFGGLLLHAAQHYGITGVGLTISEEQYKLGNARIQHAGLGDRIKIVFQDFTRCAGQFDKVVSVGMMEHVPRKEYGAYFARIRALLRDGGLGLVHTLGCNAARNAHDPFIQKYVFPASNQPRLSEIASGLERHRLAIVDVENMVRHYALTGRRWLERFEQNASGLDGGKYDERFKRMWRYYFACGIAATDNGSDTALYQVLFTTFRADQPALHRV